MPIEDEILWNSRYQIDSRPLFEPPRTLLQEYSTLLPASGLVLDIAMGLGQNANYLIEHGLRVIGVDISHVALSKVKSKIPDLMAVVSDLNHFYIPPNKFDLIINFLYLQRDLWLSIVHGMKVGGFLFVECLTREMLSIHPDLNPCFLLEPDELKQAFHSLDIISHIDIIRYFEGWQSTNTSHPRAVASLIARRVK